MKEETLKEFVDNIIKERMQNAFRQKKSGKEKTSEDDVEKEYQEALIERMDDANEIQMRHLNKLLEQTEELIDQLLG